MKIKNLVCAFLLLAFIVGCRKNDSENITEKADKVKLEEWFSKLAPKATGLKKELKEKLKESLVVGESWKSKGGPEGSMLIVPLNDTYRLKNNADKQVKNYLTIEMDVSGNYTNGFIWQVAAGSSLTNNTFYNLYMGFDGDLNGNYDKLDVWDNLISRSKYENGKPKSFGRIETKKTNTQRTSGLVCTEYYEVTTIFDAQTGEILDQTTDYLYTTCVCSSANTVQTTLIGPGDCDDSGGGSDGGDDAACTQAMNECFSGSSPSSTNLPSETIVNTDLRVTKNVGWIFHSGSSLVGATNWSLKSKERATVVRPTVSNTWIFESFEHVQDWLEGTIYCGDVEYTVTNKKHEAFNTLAQAQFWYNIKHTYTCDSRSRIRYENHYSSKRWTANEISTL